ncbi:MAG: SdpI family protein [Armatimonadota bacterium]
MQCPKCGTEATGDVCAACGAYLTEETPRWYAEGIVHLAGEKQFSMAQELLQEGLQRYPTSPMLWFNAGVLAELLKKPQDAAAYYQKAYYLKPTSEKYRQTLERVLGRPVPRLAPPAQAPVPAPPPPQSPPVPVEMAAPVPVETVVASAMEATAISPTKTEESSSFAALEAQLTVLSDQLVSEQPPAAEASTFTAAPEVGLDPTAAPEPAMPVTLDQTPEEAEPETPAAEESIFKLDDWLAEPAPEQEEQTEPAMVLDHAPAAAESVLEAPVDNIDVLPAETAETLPAPDQPAEVEPAADNTWTLEAEAPNTIEPEVEAAQYESHTPVESLVFTPVEVIPEPAQVVEEEVETLSLLAVEETPEIILPAEEDAPVPVPEKPLPEWGGEAPAEPEPEALAESVDVIKPEYLETKVAPAEDAHAIEEHDDLMPMVVIADDDIAPPVAVASADEPAEPSADFEPMNLSAMEEVAQEAPLPELSLPPAATPVSSVSGVWPGWRLVHLLSGPLSVLAGVALVVFLFAGKGAQFIIVLLIFTALVILRFISSALSGHDPTQRRR